MHKLAEKQLKEKFHFITYVTQYKRNIYVSGFFFKSNLWHYNRPETQYTINFFSKIVILNKLTFTKVCHGLPCSSDDVNLFEIKQNMTIIVVFQAGVF